MEDLLVGQLLEREDFSNVSANDSLFGASEVKRRGDAPAPTASRANDDALDLGVLDKLDLGLDEAPRAPEPPPRPAKAPEPAAAAPPPPAVDDNFDFASYINQAQAPASGGGLFD